MTNKKNKAKSFITCKQKGSNPYLINKGRVVMDDREIVEDFLESLQKPHRQVFVLRYWYFMSVKEIMKCCNMSKSKVETILFRTRKKLREQLAERKYL